MARPLKTLAKPQPGADPDPVTAFAAKLRELRRRSKLTLREVAERAGVSVGLLSAAHSGTTMPTWHAVASYVRGCGDDPLPWKQRWCDLRSERACAPARVGVQLWAQYGYEVRVPLGASEAELVALLAEMRVACGLSLREIAERAPYYSHHTYGAVLRGARPLTADALLGLLKSFGITRPNEVEDWMAALLHVRPQDVRTITRVLHQQESRRRLVAHRSREARTGTQVTFDLGTEKITAPEALRLEWRRTPVVDPM